MALKVSKQSVQNVKTSMYTGIMLGSMVHYGTQVLSSSMLGLKKNDCVAVASKRTMALACSEERKILANFVPAKDAFFVSFEVEVINTSYKEECRDK